MIRVLLVLVIVYTAAAQFGGGNKKTYTAERRDLPYISCEVCSAVVKTLHEQVAYNRGLYGPKSSKGKKMPEEVVSDILDNVCEAEKEGGEWIRYYDIVSTPVDGKDTKRKLALEGNESPGKCKRECVLCRRYRPKRTCGRCLTLRRRPLSISWRCRGCLGLGRLWRPRRCKCSTCF